MSAAFRTVATCGALVSCAESPGDRVKERSDAVNALAEPLSGLVAVSAD
jgi:hypothetical protein